MILEKHKLAVWAASFLSLSGLLDVILRCEKIGFTNGLIEAAQDPGKVLFFLFLLPIAAFVLIRTFPEELLCLNRTRKIVAYSLGLCLLAISLLLTIDDAEKGFCDRSPMPSHFSDDLIAKNLYAERQILRTLVDNARFPDRSITPQSLEEMRKAVSNQARSANTRYQELVEKEFSKKYTGQWKTECNFITHSSFRAKWAVFNTFQALLIVSLLIWIIVLHIAAGRPLNNPMREALIIVFSVLVPWLVFRSYSEWYSSFGDMSFSRYTPLLLAIILSFLVFALIGILQHRGRALVIAASFMVATSSLVATISQINPEWFGYLVSHFSILSPIELLTVYFLVLLLFGSALWYMLETTISGNHEHD
ncbi:hypothetical protein [Thiorhodococcus fuscus]|uniref:Uncharacterized protein n=1 Tax=Thiorhodococcus fuscus TaxID=527200 RepID=A0ABW4Y768_9GAMM